uniref:Uncharacterized protein n=1 Tax=Arundo donax TaxID=35708 RepID=A0A0A9AMD5_ARUDO
MQNCKGAVTPMSLTDKLSLSSGDALSPDEATQYRSTVSML